MKSIRIYFGKQLKYYMDMSSNPKNVRIDIDDETVYKK